MVGPGQYETAASLDLDKLAINLAKQRMELRDIGFGGGFRIFQFFDRINDPGVCICVEGVQDFIEKYMDLDPTSASRSFSQLIDSESTYYRHRESDLAHYKPNPVWGLKIISRTDLGIIEYVHSSTTNANDKIARTTRYGFMAGSVKEAVGHLRGLGDKKTPLFKRLLVAIDAQLDRQFAENQ